MLQCLGVYRDPSTAFEVQTWSGRCTLTPLGLAIELSGYDMQHVLKALVVDAGLDPNAAYEIVDHELQIRILTNPLTHLLARWSPWRAMGIRHHVLNQLIDVGADAAAPALFEVTPLHPGGEIPQRALSGQSLMALQLAEQLPISHIIDVIESCNAGFRPMDPAGLFVRNVPVDRSGLQFLWCTMNFLCPTMEERLQENRIAGGMLQPGEAAHGELRRVVQGFDLESGMNILHMYVERGGGKDSTAHAASRLRMLRDVYGLSLLTPTLDGQGVTALAASQTLRSTRLSESEKKAGYMREAVATVIEEELLPRHRALAMVQGLSAWPLNVLREIGRHSGLPMLGARQLHDRLHPLR